MTGQPVAWIVEVKTDSAYADVFIQNMNDRWPGKVTQLFQENNLTTYRIATSDSDVDEILDDGGIIVTDVYPE